MSGRRRWWLCVPAIVSYSADVIATLVGQPPEYWAGRHHLVEEANPVAAWLLALNPWLAVSLGLVWATAFCLAIRWWRYGAAAAGILAVGHAVGAASWLVQLGWPGWIGIAVLFVLVERLWNWCRKRSLT